MTMAEIARRLGTTPASCYPMVETLTAVGYLVRNPARRTYQLGPELIKIGEAASRIDDRLRQCREALIKLSDELGQSLWLYRIDRDRVHVLDEAWFPGTQGLPRVGQHYRLRPPTGALFVAWEHERAMQHWLDLGQLHGEERIRCRERLTRVREAGYAVSLMDEGETAREIMERLHSTKDPLESWRLAESLACRPPLSSSYLLVDPDPDVTYTISSIDAPIVGRSGKVEFAIGVLALRADGATVKEIATKLRREAERLSEDKPR